MLLWHCSLNSSSLLLAFLFHLTYHLQVYVQALRYEAAETAYNLNQNQSAEEVLDYAGVWDNHTFNPSPTNWRMPFYTIFLDRFVNGNPSNDDANSTAWEQDVTGTQLRNGGDVKGLADTLDYLEGMGIRVRISRLAPFFICLGSVEHCNNTYSCPGSVPCRHSNDQSALGVGRLQSMGLVAS